MENLVAKLFSKDLKMFSSKNLSLIIQIILMWNLKRGLLNLSYVNLDIQLLQLLAYQMGNDRLC